MANAAKKQYPTRSLSSCGITYTDLRCKKCSQMTVARLPGRMTGEKEVLVCDTCDNVESVSH